MVIENRSKLQDIATDRIADFDLAGRAGEFTSIARVLEMVEESVTEHVEKYPVASDQCPATNESRFRLPACLRRATTWCRCRLRQYGRAKR